MGINIRNKNRTYIEGKTSEKSTPGKSTEQLPTFPADFREVRDIMKLGVALLFFAALTQAKVPIEEGLQREIAKIREENADILKELRAEIAKLHKANAEQRIELRKANLRQANQPRQDDIEGAVEEIVARQLSGYQKKNETTSQLTAYLKKSQADAKIRSYLASHHLCQAGKTWGYSTSNGETITYSPAFPRTPTLSVSLGGFRSKTMSEVGDSAYVKSYPPWNVESETASSFKITWSGNHENMYSDGIAWIACM